MMTFILRFVTGLGLTLTLVSWLFSCVDEVQLPERSVESRLVVEGVITNEAPPYSVKLTFTGVYNSLIYGQKEIPVIGALVSITEVGGRTVYLDQDPVTPLYYWMRDSSFIGKVGESYQLKVQLTDGKIYISQPDVLKEVPEIDRIYAEFRPRSESEFSKPDSYEILLETKDPSTAGNYYRWSGYGYVPRAATGEKIGLFGFCCRLCWIPNYGDDTEILSDAYINGNSISRKRVLSSPIFYTGRHYIEIKQYSLTRPAYEFWVKFEEQRKRNGSLFDPLPATIEGNVYREDDPNTLALGYFGSSAVSKRKLIVPGDTFNLERLMIKYDNTFTANGNCTRAYSQGQLSPPEIW